MNVVYEGVDNPLFVAVDGYSANETQVTSADGDIKGDKGHYLFLPKFGIDTAKINILVKGKVVTQKIFRVKKMPHPVAYIAGCWDNITSIKNIINSKGLIVSLDTDYDLAFKVVGFELNSSAKQLTMTSQSDELTKEMIAAIKELNSGDRVVVSNIKARIAKNDNAPIHLLFPIILEIR